jgi:TRAP-type C4-dicarboxylate transport system permease small subunit
MNNTAQKEARLQKIGHLFLFLLPRVLIGLFLVIMVAINLANVVGRHAFGQAIFWAEEIMRLCMVWGVFLGAIAVTFRRDHLSMDLISENFRKPFSTILNVLSSITLIAVAAYVAYYSYQVAGIISATGRVSDAAQYPMIIQHAAVFIAMMLMVVAVLLSWRKYISGRARE